MGYIGRCAPSDWSKSQNEAQKTGWAWISFSLLSSHFLSFKDPYKRRKTKPKTNEQTLGFSEKARMEYKRRIRVTHRS